MQMLPSRAFRSIFYATTGKGLISTNKRGNNYRSDKNNTGRNNFPSKHSQMDQETYLEICKLKISVGQSSLKLLSHAS